jgi:hypothetical protein
MRPLVASSSLRGQRLASIQLSHPDGPPTRLNRRGFGVRGQPAIFASGEASRSLPEARVYALTSFGVRGWRCAARTGVTATPWWLGAPRVHPPLSAGWHSRAQSTHPSSQCRPTHALQSRCFRACPAMPNPSLNLTRYGRRRKPGLQYASYPCSPGLHRLPPRSG